MHFRRMGSTVLAGAKQHHIPRAEFTPVGKNRGQRSVDFTCSKLKKSVTGTPCKCVLQALAEMCIQRQRVVHLSQSETAVRGEYWNNSDRGHKKAATLYPKIDNFPVEGQGTPRVFLYPKTKRALLALIDLMHRIEDLGGCVKTIRKHRTYGRSPDTALRVIAAEPRAKIASNGPGSIGNYIPLHPRHKSFFSYSVVLFRFP